MVFGFVFVIFSSGFGKCIYEKTTVDSGGNFQISLDTLFMFDDIACVKYFDIRNERKGERKTKFRTSKLQNLECMVGIKPEISNKIYEMKYFFMLLFQKVEST